MKILVLSSWFPYPPDNGSKIRIYNLLKQLARRHELSLLSFAEEGQGGIKGDLTTLCESVEVVQRIPYCPKRLRAVLGLFSLTPRSIVDTYSHVFAQRVRRQLAEQKYDLVLASQIGTAPYVSRGATKATIFEEIETEVIRDASRKAKAGLPRFRCWLTWMKLSHYMAHLVDRFDACTVASQAEKANLRTIVPGYDRIHVIPNGVDLDYYAPMAEKPVPDTLIYNGALTYAANYDAVLHFLSEIWPRIQLEIPQVQLKVTGSTRGVATDRLPLRNGVTFTGYVNDIRPIVAQSWACIVPLRIGGGTRLKILEAMALGTPVVSTSKGAEGLDVTPGENILIADDPAEFAAQTVRLLRDAGLRQHLGRNGRKLVEQRYSWHEIGRQLNELLDFTLQAKERS